MMSHLCNRCVREFLILARTWFAFGLPSKPGVTEGFLYRPLLPNSVASSPMLVELWKGLVVSPCLVSSIEMNGNIYSLANG
jgi:hypothetical protein